MTLVAYQLPCIRKLKLNSLKDQIYTDTKIHQRIMEESK